MNPMNARESEATHTRRTVLQGIAVGAAALPLGAVFGRWTPSPRGAQAPRPAKARSVIEIWLAGGPSHLDTFDPKPEAGSDYSGPLSRPIATNVDGVRISELLPLLAQQADKYSLLRSMTHGLNAHETAAYSVQTGRDPAERLVYPSLGAVVSLLRGYDKGYQGLIPPYIALTEAQGRFSEAGFLGPRFQPFATGGDPNQKRFAVEGVVAEGISDERQAARRDLLHALDALGRALPENPRLAQLDRGEEKAYGLILGDAGKLFDLTSEKDELRERYGRNKFGQSCLMARRLVESGVPYVTINSGGWDTHKQNFEVLRRRLPELDRGLASLLADLSDRGLLDTTIVWCGGEFGRTPKVQWEAPWNGGRGHHGACFSTLVAGGGFAGGQVVGATDAQGMEVRERPIHPRDVQRSMFELLGIDPDGTLAVVGGAEVRVSDPTAAATGGRLAELMG